MRALVVDDDESSCQLLAKILQGAGIDTEWTTVSQMGLAHALQRWYDLVILDVQMPGLLGTDIAAELKHHHPDMPIVLISAFPDEHLHHTTTQLGVALLAKPFTPDALLTLTSQALATRVS